MNLISRFLVFLVYSNFWIGLGAALVTWQTYLILDYPINFEVISFVFFATILTYTFQRSVKLLGNVRHENPRLKWMRKNDLLVKAILILSTVACIRHAFYFTFDVYLLLGVCGFLSLFYIVKIPGRLGKNLRDIPSLKIFLIALVWSATATIIPYLNYKQHEIDFPLILFLANFIFIIALTIPFDIRDLALDEPEKKTIPQVLGDKKSVQLAVLLLLIYWPLICAISEAFLYFSLVGVSLAIILVYGAQKTKNDFYFSFVIDGLLIVMPLLFWCDIYYFS